MERVSQSVWYSAIEPLGRLPRKGHLEQSQIFPGETTLPKHIQGDSIKSSEVKGSYKHCKKKKKKLFLPQLVLNTLLVFDGGSQGA